MLTAHIDRYIALRQALGFKLRDTARGLHAFARFAAARGDTHIRTSTAVAWATDAPSPSARHIRLRDVVHLARFLRAEDAGHEVPPATLFPAPKVRPLPYIYTPEEVAQIVAAAGNLRRTYPLRREVYATLFGLIAATGLRVSEALDLRFDDLQPNSVLLIRRAKFGKSRLVPLHPTVAEALDRYLDRRRRLAVTDDHVFLSASDRRIGASMVNYTFRRVVRLAGVAAGRTRPCRIHHLRHTFATRSLQQCSKRRI
jgi:integrase/recombinase XerD